jgi:hypothetical protein
LPVATEADEFSPPLAFLANAKTRLVNEFKNSLGVDGTFEVKLRR